MRGGKVERKMESSRNVWAFNGEEKPCFYPVTPKRRGLHAEIGKTPPHRFFQKRLVTDCGKSKLAERAKTRNVYIQKGEGLNEGIKALCVLD